MPKILVRTPDAPEQLKQMEDLLRTEGENVIHITPEEPLSSATQQDVSDKYVWFITEQDEIADGLFNVVIVSDEAKASGADLLVQIDTFSPSAVIDEVKARLGGTGEIPLMILVDGYIVGTTDALTFKPGMADHAAADPQGILQLWKDRLSQANDPGAPEGSEPSATESEENQDPTSDEDAKYAIPRINVGSGW